MHRYLSKPNLEAAQLHTKRLRRWVVLRSLYLDESATEEAHHVVEKPITLPRDGHQTALFVSIQSTRV